MWTLLKTMKEVRVPLIAAQMPTDWVLSVCLMADMPSAFCHERFIRIRPISISVFMPVQVKHFVKIFP